MNKTLVVCYSRSGRTRRVARMLARRLTADLEEIDVLQSRKGPWGYAQSALESMAQMAPAIAPPRHDGAGYELVVIGGPVWFWGLSSPLRSWLLQARLGQAHVAFFCTMGGAGAWRMFEMMQALVGKKPVATMAIAEKALASQGALPIEDFVQQLKAGVAPRKPARRTHAAARAAAA